MLNIFIGWDSREVTAWHVLAHSILARVTRPVAITALIQNNLRGCGYYKRGRGPTESTEFSITRFLVPFLSGYEGKSLFLDCDMLCLADISYLVDQISLREEIQGQRAVWVCQHDYTPRDSSKFLGQKQTAYPRKNWSSFMLFNNERCKSLSPSYVNTASGLDLHRFNWLKDEDIGSLPIEWNWLVGEYPARDISELKMLHYTLGGPWFESHRHTDYAEQWFAERNAMNQEVQVLA